MTQDGFAAADRITATLDAVSAALLGSRATHYPADALTAFRRSPHPAAKALFGLRVSPVGPGLLTVLKLGTVVEAAASRRPSPGAGREALPVLAQRFGGSARGLADTTSAAALQLPAAPEPADEKLRPAFTRALAALAEPRVTVNPDELSTGAGVEARLVLPPAFHPLTVRGAGPALAAHLVESAEELFAGASAAERFDWALVAALLAEEFAAAQVAYAGVGALTVDGRPSRVSLVVATAHRPQPIQELALALSTERPHAEVWTVLLPAGPAAVLVEARTVPVPAPLSGDGRRSWVVSSVVEAFVPMPDGATVLTVQLSTPNSEDWELYTGVFADLLCRLQMAWDGVAAAVTPGPATAAAAPSTPVASPPPAPAQPVQTPPVQTPPVPAPAASAPAAPPAASVPAVSVPAQASASPPPVAPVAQPDPDAGTPVRVPAADFNPFATPAPADLPAQPTPVLASADPFGSPAADQFGASAADQLSVPTPAPAAPRDEVPPSAKGTPVRVPPSDFNPFAPPAPAPAPAAAAPAAAPAAAEDDDLPGKGTWVHVPPADFNPFAQTTPPPPATPAPAAPVADPFGSPAADPFGSPAADPFATPAAADPFAAAAAPVVEEEENELPGKGTWVKVPPPDFNPFAPPAPPTQAAAPAAAEDDDLPGKGTWVHVPPADFNPFAQTTPPPATPAATAPAAAPAPVAPARPANADPFGTVISVEPPDPFGTTLGSAPVIPPKPTTPPMTPPPPAADEDDNALPGKGTWVKVPPPDFNPFAPPAPPTQAAAPAAAEDDDLPGKGTWVHVPPADFNPFAQTSPPPATPSAAPPPAPSAPPAARPFG